MRRLSVEQLQAAVEGLGVIGLLVGDAMRAQLGGSLGERTETALGTVEWLGKPTPPSSIAACNGIFHLATCDQVRAARGDDDGSCTCGAYQIWENRRR